MRRFLLMFLFAIVFLCFGGTASATIQLVQSNAGDNSLGNGGPYSLAFANPNTAGNLIIVSVSDLNTQISGISDGNHNTYILATSNTNSTNQSQLYYAANIAAGTNTITVNFTAWDNRTTAQIFEYSGVATSSPLDQATSSTGSSNSLNSGSVTTTQPNELIFGTGFAVNSLSAGSGYTIEQNWACSACGTFLAGEDRVVSTTGQYAATFTASGSWLWIAQIATFKAATVVSGTPTCGIHGDTTSHVPIDWRTFSPPAKGQNYVDATFGCTVTRLTDGYAAYLNSSDYDTFNNEYYSMAHNYSTATPMNAADTYVLVGSSDGNQRIVDTTGNVIVPKSTMSQLNFDDSDNIGFGWDASNGNVFYYTSGNSLWKATIGGTSPCDSIVGSSPSLCLKSMATFAQYQAVTFLGHPDLSADGTHVVLVGGDAWGGNCTPSGNVSGCHALGVFTYNIATNPGTPDPNPGTYTTQCVGSAQSNIACLHAVQLLPDNNIMIDFEFEPPSGQSCAISECGARIWNGSTLFPLQDHTNHFDFGKDLNGNIVFVELGNSSTLAGETNPCPSGWGLDVRQVYNTSSAVCLFDNDVNGTIAPWHVGYRGNAQQPWVGLSFMDQGRSPSPEWFQNDTANYTDPTSTNWYVYEDEVVLARIDANNDSSSVYRLARAYSRSNENYDGQPHAAISRDGKYIIFSSNMAHSGGCPGTAGSAGGPEGGQSSCSDVYLIKIQ